MRGIRLRSATPRPDAGHSARAFRRGYRDRGFPNDSLARVCRLSLAAIGCVRVIPASEGFDNSASATLDMRQAIDSGAAIAVASSYRTKETSSFNMQYLLHLAARQLGLSAEQAITATTLECGMFSSGCRMSPARSNEGKSADLLLMEVPDYRDLARRPGHRDGEPGDARRDYRRPRPFINFRLAVRWERWSRGAR